MDRPGENGASSRAKEGPLQLLNRISFACPAGTWSAVQDAAATDGMVPAAMDARGGPARLGGEPQTARTGLGARHGVNGWVIEFQFIEPSGGLGGSVLGRLGGCGRPLTRRRQRRQGSGMNGRRSARCAS